jgi:hypothetical protein
MSQPVEVTNPYSLCVGARLTNKLCVVFLCGMCTSIITKLYIDYNNDFEIKLPMGMLMGGMLASSDEQQSWSAAVACHPMDIARLSHSPTLLPQCHSHRTAAAADADADAEYTTFSLSFIPAFAIICL